MPRQINLEIVMTLDIFVNKGNSNTSITDT